MIKYICSVDRSTVISYDKNDEVKNHYNRLLEKGQEEKKKSISCDIECDCTCEPVQCGC